MDCNTWLIKDDRVNPYSFYSEVFVYYLMWGFIYNIVFKLEQKYNLFKRLPQEKHIEARTRILATINAVILTSSATCYYCNYIDYNHWLCFVPLSSAFGLYDMTVLTINYKDFKKNYPATCVHHFIVIFAPMLITEENSRAVLHAYMFETTVPFLDLSWYLYNAKITDTIFFKINTLVAVIIFFFFRVVNSLYIVYIVHKEGVMIMLFALQFLFLNVYWFNTLVDVVLKIKST